ncbi:hypothetical protein [Enterococcus columbae]|uniref:Uncharacterized protein n=1 Tax=Enterococcus columbae DSM 7374 = ATCC 51263 TaxID=1121865 RepID=S0KHH4_9ENTE|nr:hypothetical protein [Enterococcus columbae]EOT44279.1 hypothetical protein OMW_00335 [Enterococcus columbae DSM 7374 = ATCC 51263]EOW84437.1 hypothetical protein I568_00933 [Enterococcus columbae DSM 7374 = ATCC 51263]OJG26003.1 hypothetical protein RR47_GL000801 [Enterococcus columbae DSM 7374 = ATCC 51263]
MNDVYLAIILDVINEKYYSEKVFCQNQLAIEEKDWQAWKSGQYSLTPEQTQKIKNLFTDYEWMLFQKVLRQTVIYPEKRSQGVMEYRQMKLQIARKWMDGQLAKIELLNDSLENQEFQALLIAVGIDYEQWGFDDILTFRIPARLQKQLANDQVKLLDWFDAQIQELQ